MTENTSSDANRQPTRLWLDGLMNEFLKLEASMPRFLSVGDDVPEWVKRLELGIGDAIFRVVKVKKFTNVTPRRTGAMLGHLHGLVEWLEEWFTAEIPRIERGLTVDTKCAARSLLVMANTSILKQIALGRSGENSAGQQRTAENAAGRRLLLTFDLSELEVAAERLGRMGEEATGEHASKRIAVVGLTTVSARDGATRNPECNRLKVASLDGQELETILSSGGEEPWRRIPGMEDVHILLCDWQRAFDVEEDSTCGSPNEIASAEKAAEAAVVPQSSNLRYGYVDLEQTLQLAKKRRSWGAPTAGKVVVAMMDETALDNAIGEIRKLRVDFLPGVRQLTTLALVSCVNRSHDEMQDFLRGFADGHARKPRGSRMGDIGGSDFEIKMIMATCWPVIQHLNSVRELHEILQQSLEPQRAGGLKRIEKLCQRIGLRLGKPGRPRKAKRIQTP